MGTMRKPRRALPARLSDRETGTGSPHHDDACGGARDRRRALGARSGASRGARRVTAPASLLSPEAFLSPLVIDEAVRRALDEDLGRAGDITSISTIPEGTQAHAILVARQAGVVAGLPLAVAVFRQLSPDINIQAHARDGKAVAAGMHMLVISG